MNPNGNKTPRRRPPEPRRARRAVDPARSARRPSSAREGRPAQRLPGVRLPLLPARPRAHRQLLDEESFEEWFTDLGPCDPLGFKDRLPYAERLKAEQAKTGMRDAAVVGRGFIRGRPVVFGVTDFAFMAGSMGSVVGEKLTRAAEEATRLQLPLIFVSGSGGGARMQEGILSLMQMAKVSAALARYDSGRRAVRVHPDQPDDGRRGGELRPAGRHHPGRAGRPDRLRRQADHLEHACGWSCPKGFQTSEFLLRARLHGPHRPPQGPAHGAGPDHRLLRTLSDAVEPRRSACQPLRDCDSGFLADRRSADCTRSCRGPVRLLQSVRRARSQGQAQAAASSTSSKRFELLGRTGQGSMSKVWRARDNEPGPHRLPEAARQGEDRQVRGPLPGPEQAARGRDLHAAARTRTSCRPSSTA